VRGSTPRALEWDESFRGRADPSGRAIASVHESAYTEAFTVEEGQRGTKRKAEANGATNGKTVETD
jgi:hypothetical protein